MTELRQPCPTCRGRGIKGFAQGEAVVCLGCDGAGTETSSSCANDRVSAASAASEPQPVKTKQKSQVKRLILWMIATGAIVAGLGAIRSYNTSNLVEMAQTVLDRIEGNPAEVKAVNVPKLAFIPFVGPTEWKSYIFVSGRDGKELDMDHCPTTIDYEVKLSTADTLFDSGSVAISVNVGDIRDCAAKRSK